MFRNMKVSTRLILGFGLVSLVIVIMSLVGLGYLGSAREGFDKSRALSEQVKYLSAINTNLALARTQAVKYTNNKNIKLSEELVNGFQKYENNVNKNINKISELFTKQEYIVKIQTIKSDFEGYSKWLDKIVELHDNFLSNIYGDISKYGSEMVNVGDSIVKTYINKDYKDILNQAYKLHKSLLEIRLLTSRFMILEEEKLYENIIDLMDKDVENAEAILKTRIVGDTRFDKLDLDKKEYRSALKDIKVDILGINNLMDKELSKLGLKITTEISDLLSEIKSQQETIGKEVSSKDERSSVVMAIFAVAALLISVLLTIIITRSIKKVLGAEPAFLGNVFDQVTMGKLEIDWGKEKNNNGGMVGSIKRMIGALESRSQTIERIADGDFNARVNVASDVDVVGRAMLNMTDSLKRKSGLLERMADGDFTVNVKLASQRDELGHSMIRMTNSLNSMFRMINTTANEVKSGSEQLALSSHELSEGASDQAASLEEISASLSEISSQVQTNTENVVNARELSEIVNVSAQEGNEKMNSLVEAMNSINKSAEQIRSIVKVIDDIAFQTNLLALNANIEAARVGKYGKGFAVVAESVRNLATESAESVRDTTEQVEVVIKNIEEGNSLVVETAEQFRNIVSKSAEVNNLVNEVASASQEQSRGIEQISTALNQVENIVQSNTANAEENASTSSELSRQAIELDKMISKYNFRKTENEMLTGEDYDEIKKLPPEKLRNLISRMEKEGEEKGFDSYDDGETNIKLIDEDF